MQTVYCLNCRAANRVDRVSCIMCGLPLPTHLDTGSSRTLDGGFSNPPEYVSERLELLEDRVGHLGKALEEILELMQTMPQDNEARGFHQHLSPDPAESWYRDDVALDAFWRERMTGYLCFVRGRDNHRKRASQIRSCYNGDNPEHFCRLIERAQILFYSNQHLKAMKLFERALRKSPDNHELLFLIGEKYLLLEQPGRALEIWELVLELQPEHEKALLMSGILKMLEGSFAGARALLIKSAQLNSGNFVPLLALAALEMQDNRLAESRIFADRANERMDTAFGHVIIAEIFSRTKQPKNASKEFEQALKLQPGDKHILIRLATLYMNMGYTRRARETFSRISRISPKETIFKELAATGTQPEMQKLASGRLELSSSSMVLNSVSELLMSELER